MQYSRSWAAGSPSEATEELARVYRVVRVSSAEPEGFGLTASESGDARLSLSAMHWAGAGRLHAEADAFYTVCDVYEGSVALAAGGEALDTTRLVLTPIGALEASWEGPYRMRAVRVDRAAIDTFAREHFGLPGLNVGFTGSSPRSAAHDALWRAVERHVREDVIAHGEHLHDDLIWEAARRHLTATLLAVFPNTTHGIAPARDGAGAQPASVRRAIAYMEEHLSESVSLADMAGAARLSPRGLLAAFRRVLGTTPSQQLRLLRLEAARNELIESDPANGHTVAAIARRWGFAHPARFAEAYRARFGENPSATLRR